MPDHKTATLQPGPTEEIMRLQIGPAQVEQLAALGVLSEAQLQAGRQAGGLNIGLPAHLVQQFQQTSEIEKVELETLARRIDNLGLNGPARLFLASNRPLSFFASQILLLAQPFSRLALGAKDPTGRYSHLLEDRHNLDWLIARLDNLEAERRKGNRPAKPLFLSKTDDQNRG